MGNFLDQPITTKSSGSDAAHGLRYGVSSMQGWRCDMEDAHSIVTDIPSLAGHAFFAVFDGHAGSLVAKYSGENLIGRLLTEHEDQASQMTPEALGRALREAYLKLDDDMRKLPGVESGQDHSGSTAISALVSESYIIVANTGDSRAVLAKGGKTVSLSWDHKPYDKREQARIEKAGGAVQNKRVNGDLAVSRALGDFIYKSRDDLRPEEQQVSAEPDIHVEARDGSEEFMVIACDGVWDVMSSDDVLQYVRSLLQLGEEDCGLMAEELIDHCLELGSRDNLSAIIICFPAAKAGKGKGVKGLREKRDAEKAAQEAKAAAATS